MLGLPPDAFTRHLADGELGTVRLMRYPPASEAAARNISGVGGDDGVGGGGDGVGGGGDGVGGGGPHVGIGAHNRLRGEIN